MRCASAIWSDYVRDALNKTSTQQFMKFAAVGIFSFVVDWLLLVILT